MHQCGDRKIDQPAAAVQATAGPAIPPAASPVPRPAHPRYHDLRIEEELTLDALLEDLG